MKKSSPARDEAKSKAIRSWYQQDSTENLHVSCLQSHHGSGNSQGIAGNLSPEETTLLTVPSSVPPDWTPKSTVKKAKDSHGHPHGVNASIADQTDT